MYIKKAFTSTFYFTFILNLSTRTKLSTNIQQLRVTKYIYRVTWNYIHQWWRTGGLNSFCLTDDNCGNFDHLDFQVGSKYLQSWFRGHNKLYFLFPVLQWIFVKPKYMKTFLVLLKTGFQIDQSCLSQNQHCTALNYSNRRTDLSHNF